MHVNIGKPFPWLQVILWRSWLGIRWHRWPSGIGVNILRGSLLLGCVELRFWRRSG